jgi:hypothetical protein
MLEPGEVWEQLRAWANSHGHLRAVEVFRQFDADRNGFISLDEFKTLLLEVRRKKGGEVRAGNEEGKMGKV